MVWGLPQTGYIPAVPERFPARHSVFSFFLPPKKSARAPWFFGLVLWFFSGGRPNNIRHTHRFFVVGGLFACSFSFASDGGRRTLLRACAFLYVGGGTVCECSCVPDSEVVRQVQHAGTRKGSTRGSHGRNNVQCLHFSASGPFGLHTENKVEFTISWPSASPRPEIFAARPEDLGTDPDQPDICTHDACADSNNPDVQQ